MTMKAITRNAGGRSIIGMANLDVIQIIRDTAPVSTNSQDGYDYRSGSA
jgi:hypothetical protein